MVHTSELPFDIQFFLEMSSSLGEKNVLLEFLDGTICPLLKYQDICMHRHF